MSLFPLFKLDELFMNLRIISPAHRSFSDITTENWNYILLVIK